VFWKLGKRLFEEKARADNQKNPNELRGLSTVLLSRALQRQPENAPAILIIHVADAGGYFVRSRGVDDDDDEDDDYGWEHLGSIELQGW